MTKPNLKDITAIEKLRLLKKAVTSLRDVLQSDDRFDIDVSESETSIDLKIQVKEKH